MNLPVLSNADARRLFLHRHALCGGAGPGTGRDGLRDLIRRLGFVQLDSINTVARAQDLILFTRRPSYRPGQLSALLERDRAVFEHWTHDAAVIPTEFYPYWQHRFRREADRLKHQWRNWQRREFEDRFEDVLAHVRDRGPARSRDVGEGEERGASGGWWDWHPSKTALEYLWRTGKLAVCRRDGFQKVYDLAERVVPAEHHTHRTDHEEFVDWACRAALDRLGFATSGEIAAFWALITPEEAKNWCAEKLGKEIFEINIECAGGVKQRRCFAFPDVIEEAAAAPAPTGAMRVLSPFDPALRDRNRAERLFGFHYRIEIFVPEPKRRYGYYVFPLLEGSRLVGRIDMKCQRDDGMLAVRALWPEPGVRFGRGRMDRLERALDRVARFTGMERMDFADGWLREPLIG